MHRRIAEVLRDQFAAEPELLAHHFTQAGLTEAAIEWWDRAGQRSLQRSALLEAIAQFTRALDQIAILPTTPALRREEIKLQVALITPLIHVKGYAAPETKAAAERARLLIEQAEALGQPPEDPLLLFTVLYSFWVADFVRFNGDAMRELSAKFLTLAEKQGTSVPLMIGHRLMGASLMLTGDIAEGRSHYDQALALYDPAEHRSLAMRFAQDIRVAILSYRSQALWLLGYPEAALTDTRNALDDAREIGQAATLMYALHMATYTAIYCGDYAAAEKHSDELIALGHEKATPIWKALGIMHKGWILFLTGKASEAVPTITSVMAGPVADAIMPAAASPSTGSRLERTTVQPDEEEISALIKLAQGFLSNRDISSARLLLRRAAEAGSAAAALSPGETFDPLVIRQLHAIGVQPDPAKAREWYERAAQLGSDAASQHLAKLAQSPQ